MNNKLEKLQVYLDANTYNYLKKISDEIGISLSRYATSIIEKGISNDLQDRAHKKTHLMLTHLLKSVYDDTIAISNAGNVENLLTQIDGQLEKTE